jgi:hypothetical protein
LSSVQQHIDRYKQIFAIVVSLQTTCVRTTERVRERASGRRNIGCKVNVNVSLLPHSTTIGIAVVVVDVVVGVVGTVRVAVAVAVAHRTVALVASVDHTPSAAYTTAVVVAAAAAAALRKSLLLVVLAASSTGQTADPRWFALPLALAWKPEQPDAMPMPRKDRQLQQAQQQQQ